MQENEHKFEFKLGKNSHDGSTLLMDGKELEGVTGLCVRAGINGITNVAIEFEAGTAIKMAAHLIANLDLPDERWEIGVFGGIFDEAVEAIPILREFHFDGADKMDFVKSIVTKCLERL